MRMAATSAHLELVLAASPSEGIDCWGVHSGAFIKEIKAPNLHAFSLADPEHALVSHADKPSLHVFSAKTGQTKCKSSLPERAETLCVSAGGAILVAGSPTGLFFSVVPFSVVCAPHHLLLQASCTRGS